MNPFFDELAALWVRAAAERGATIEPPALTAEIADELLELARIAAHTQERRFAPLVSYTAGVAAERLRRANSEADAVGYIRSVRQLLQRSQSDIPVVE